VPRYHKLDQKHRLETTRGTRASLVRTHTATNAASVVLGPPSRLKRALCHAHHRDAPLSSRDVARKLSGKSRRPSATPAARSCIPRPRDGILHLDKIFHRLPPDTSPAPTIAREVPLPAEIRGVMNSTDAVFATTVRTIAHDAESCRQGESASAIRR